MEMVTTHSKCRICKSTKLFPLLSLGDLYVSEFVSSDEDVTIKAPLDLVMCDLESGGCGLVQLRHTVAPEQLYRNYWYRSFTNESMRVALAEIVHCAEDIISLESKDIVLDIGCNDGTLLRAYRAHGIRRIGFEPSRNLLVFAQQGNDLIINDFFNAKAFRREIPKEKAKVITTIAMFYDLEDPNSFVADICECLHPSGVWINQLSYLPSMLEQNAFDNICHEHLEYYTLTVFANLVGQHGLEVFDVELNDVNGGSFRVFVRHKGTKVGTTDGFGPARVEALMHFENHLGIAKHDLYAAFSDRVQKAQKQLMGFVRSELARGKKIYGYGASTKGNTLLQFYGLDVTLIPAIADRNSDKWGKRTVGTNIPIISEEQARREQPDYLLVLPWHFLNNFQEREHEFLAAGGKFIVPLPSFRIVSVSGTERLQ